MLVEANEEAVWEQVEGLGGRNGWYFMDWGWTIRGWIDGMLGGVGNRRGRPDRLTECDRLDTWVVEHIERPRDLVLRSEMRMPKEARMGLHVRMAQGGSALIQWVEFHPNALTWLYWFAAYPVHRLVFTGLVSAISGRAARRAAGGKNVYVLERRQVIPRPVSEVFAFFEDPRNLAKITPSNMNFRIKKMDRLADASRVPHQVRNQVAGHRPPLADHDHGVRAGGALSRRPDERVRTPPGSTSTRSRRSTVRP